jgi:CHAD domain-containing protein
MTMITSQGLLNKARKPITQLQSIRHPPGKKKNHQIRVCIKRVLARLHLLEKVTATDPNISNLSQSLKQLSRQLATMRDRDVMLALLEQLLAQNTATSVNDLLKQTRERLIGTNQQPTAELRVLHTKAADICTNLHLIPKSSIGLSQIQHYMQKKWQRICGQYKSIVREQDQLKLHKLRKKLKSLSYQYEVLDELEPSSWLPAKKLTKLGTKLGKVHDLFVLERYLRNQQQQLTADIHTYNGAYALLGGKRMHLLKQSRKAFKHTCRAP